VNHIQNLKDRIKRLAETTSGSAGTLGKVQEGDEKEEQKRDINLSHLLKSSSAVRKKDEKGLFLPKIC